MRDSVQIISCLCYTSVNSMNPVIYSTECFAVDSIWAFHCQNSLNLKNLLIFISILFCLNNVRIIVSTGFYLGPLLQGQTWIAKLKGAYS